MTDNLKVDVNDIAEIVRTVPPPQGFEPFAVAMASVAGAPGAVFGTAVDPFKPTEIVRAPGSSVGMPPHCPTCHSLLQAIVQNPAGDTLYECLFDGYEAVCRVSGMWEVRPGRDPRGWTPPRYGEKPEGSTPGSTKVEVPQASPKARRQPMAPRKTEPAAMPPATVASAQPAEGDDRWLTLVEAAAVTGKSVNDIYKLTRTGQVPRQKNDKGLVLVDMDVLIGLGDV